MDNIEDMSSKILINKETNLTAALRKVKVLSPIFKPLSALQATSVTAGSCNLSQRNGKITEDNN